MWGQGEKLSIVADQKPTKPDSTKFCYLCFRYNICTLLCASTDSSVVPFTDIRRDLFNRSQTHSLRSLGYARICWNAASSLNKCLAVFLNFLPALMAFRPDLFYLLVNSRDLQYLFRHLWRVVIETHWGVFPSFFCVHFLVLFLFLFPPLLLNDVSFSSDFLFSSNTSLLSLLCLFRNRGS